MHASSIYGGKTGGCRWRSCQSNSRQRYPSWSSSCQSNSRQRYPSWSEQLPIKQQATLPKLRRSGRIKQQATLPRSRAAAANQTGGRRLPSWSGKLQSNSSNATPAAAPNCRPASPLLTSVSIVNGVSVPTNIDFYAPNNVEIECR